MANVSKSKRGASVLILLSGLAFSQAAAKQATLPDPGTVFSARDLASDVALMRRALEEGHAALGRHLTRAQAEERLDRLARCADEPAAAARFWRCAAAALAGLRDGHVALLPSPSLYAAYFSDPGRMLPLTVRILDGRVFVIGPRSGSPVPPGSEIVAVDGVPAPDLISRLAAYVPADAHVVSRRTRVLERDFSLLLALDSDLAGAHSIDFRAEPGAPAASAVVPTVAYRALRASGAVGIPEGRDAGAGGLDLKPGSRTAILRVATFSADRKHDVPGFLAGAFRRIREAKTEDLIVDLRGNGGGRDSLGARLYSHISRAPFAYVRSRRINKPSFDFVRGTPERWLNLQIRKAGTRPLPDSGFALDGDLDAIQQPAREPYAGRVCLLVHGLTFSTASEVASIAKHHRRAILVGEETGSAYVGDSGATVSLQLPATGLLFNLPVVLYELAVEEVEPPGRGVMPDNEVRPTLSDLVAGRDAVLEAALAIIARQRAGARANQ